MKWDSKKVSLYFENFLKSWREPRRMSLYTLENFLRDQGEPDKSALKKFLKSWEKSNKGYTWKKLKD
jgi:hypothetical protein